MTVAALSGLRQRDALFLGARLGHGVHLVAHLGAFLGGLRAVHAIAELVALGLGEQLRVRTVLAALARAGAVLMTARASWAALRARAGSSARPALRNGP